MAFRRKTKKVINLEFITSTDELLTYEVEYSKDLGEKLIQIGKDLDNTANSENEQKQYLVKAYGEILGLEALREIKEKVFDNEELSLSDLIDIGMYIIKEVEKTNKEIEEEYRLDAEIIGKSQKLNVLNVEEINDFINGKNKLSN